MFEWMRVHKLALIVSCVMFAIMAVAMVEVTLATDDLWGMLSALEDGAPAWIWRAGGLLTWPVFQVDGERHHGVVSEKGFLGGLRDRHGNPLAAGQRLLGERLRFGPLTSLEHLESRRRCSWRGLASELEELVEMGAEADGFVRFGDSLSVE